MTKFGFELCTNHSPANTQRCTVSVFLTESQTKHSFATVCPYLSTQLFSFSSQSLPCSLPCQKKISPFDYMLNCYQLAFYCPVTVLKHKTPDQENLIAFFKLIAKEENTHIDNIPCHPRGQNRTCQQEQNTFLSASAQRMPFLHLKRARIVSLQIMKYSSFCYRFRTNSSYFPHFTSVNTKIASNGWGISSKETTMT